MSKDLISVKQLPVIEEQLQSISEEIQAQTAEVLALAVTEDTVKEIKKRRTELGKSFKDLEDKRKAVKSAVMAPYEAFEEIYKKYVTDIFKPADAKLKTRIDEVESALLNKRKVDLTAYFQEVAAAYNCDFLTFDRLGIKITLSDSMKKLREQVDNALDKINGDLAVIATMDFPEEILVEYKDNLNLTSSVLTVRTRKEKLAAELRRKAETQTPPPVAYSSPIIEPAPIAEQVAPVAKEPEAIAEVTTMAEPENVPAPSKITLTITASSYEEVMAVTAVCKERGLTYFIS